MPYQFPDWKSFYSQKLGSAKMPAVASRVYTRNQAIIRDLYVDLKEELEIVAKKIDRLAAVYIYADVVRLPATYRPVVEGFALTIMTRRLECDPAAYFDVKWNRSTSGSLAIYAQDLVLHPGYPRRWPIWTTDPRGNGRNVAEDPRSERISAKGILLACLTGNPVIKFEPGIEPALLGEDSPGALSLGSIFQVATLLFSDQAHAEVASSQFAWVQACAAQSADQASLMLQSAGMLSMLQTRTPGATFVPTLSHETYAGIAKAHSDVARAFEAEHVRFSDQSRSIEDRIASARLLLERADDAIKYSDDLLAQADANLDSARSAAEKAAANLAAHQTVVEAAAVHFKVSLQQWLDQKKLDLAFQIVSAVVTFGVEAGKIAAGDPLAATSAATAVSVLRKLGAKGSAEELANFADKLKKGLETVYKAYTLVDKIIAATGSTSGASSLAEQLSKADLSESGDVAPAAWEIFRLKADEQIEGAVKEGVENSSDYRLQLRILAVHGQALSAARMAFIQAGQEVARVRLLRELHAKEKVRLQKHVDDLVARRAPNDALQQMFFQRFLDAKRSVVVAIEQYRAAFQYWALRPSSLRATVGDSVSAFDNGLIELAKTKFDQAEALKEFQPAKPAPFNESFLINDARTLEQLRTKRTATWTIDLDHKKLISLDRVRVITVRVWLIGVKPPSAEDTIEVVITNSGVYFDRITRSGKPTEKFLFAAQPLTAPFRYSLVPGGNPKVEHPDITGWVKTDGTVHAEARWAYAFPTAFTQWSIRLPKTSNPEALDLSTLTGIRMEIAGSAILNTSLNAARREQ